MNQMIADPATMPKWLECGQRTAAEMVERIQARYETLDPVRRYMFIEWLQTHSSRVRGAASLCEGLTDWFGDMRRENLGWEFRLIMGEIEWWSGLDEHSLM